MIYLFLIVFIKFRSKIKLFSICISILIVYSKILKIDFNFITLMIKIYIKLYLIIISTSINIFHFVTYDFKNREIVVFNIIFL